jgi:hypothetical protein
LALVACAALALAANARDAAGQDPTSAPEAVSEAPHAAPVSEAVPPGGEIAALRDSMAALTSRVEDVASGRTPPPWAVALRDDLDARIERVMQMQERLAARIETPLPRLDEPIILFTVAASTLILGFIVGRGLQRRRDRRDGRYRL